jgi:hypothetical protein
VQTEGVVVRTEIQYRPRRQLVCLIADPDDREAQLVLRFFTFYPSQQKALEPASACACSATCGRATSAPRSCIRNGRRWRTARRCPIA